MSWCAENLDRIWDPETVRDFIKYAERDKEKIDDYIFQAKQRLQLLQAMTWKTVVTIDKRKFDKVYYYVSVKKCAVDDALKHYYIHGYSKKFAGTERKAALEYAEKLANELGAEIERSGF